MKFFNTHIRNYFPLGIVPLMLLLFTSVDLSAQSAGKDYEIAIDNYKYFLNKQDYDKAEVQAQNAVKIAKNKKNDEAQAYALNLQAKAMMKEGIKSSRKRKNATKVLEESVVLLANSRNNSLKLDNYELLKNIAEANGDNAAAVVYSDKIRDMKDLMSKRRENSRLASNKAKLESQMADLNEDMTSLKTAKGQTDSMLVEQKMMSDSLLNKSRIDSILLLQKENVLLQQESELALQKSQRNVSYAIAGLVTLLLIGMGLRYFETSKHNAVLQMKNEIIEEERKRSEDLLLNILPSLIANELKDSGEAKARSYDNASVLFTDFVKFSAVAQKLAPEELVDVLDYYFTSFDEIISKYNVEKIKTIGDSYMLASGLPRKNKNNPMEIVKVGLEIQKFIAKAKVERKKKNLPFFEARIGIHTGPLVAGVVGHKKFAYDIWGDTVNVASRLEGTCEPGRVNISSSTYDFIKDEYKCEFRGEIPIKNRGEVGMYYVMN